MVAPDKTDAKEKGLEISDKRQIKGNESNGNICLNAVRYRAYFAAVKVRFNAKITRFGTKSL